MHQLKAQIRGGQYVILLVRWIRGNRPDNLIQAELVERLGGQNQMTVVWWIKCAAINPETHKLNPAIPARARRQCRPYRRFRFPSRAACFQRQGLRSSSENDALNLRIPRKSSWQPVQSQLR